jgi:hypothetical protein
MKPSLNSTWSLPQKQHLATYPEVRVAELASKPTNGRAISSASNFITIGSTKLKTLGLLSQMK